ncbi:DNA helicase PIF1, ATP-dependent [Corchorus olitorius]|uniref:ATP-dependent DNA helicase n=1 Tax=Corchorus olitorius TaxID=93759 RepID=A0A1R3KK25_9ROSI|nr:DNA helicase PIF1, ATP-dependent [Corchorus olitorius]
MLDVRRHNKQRNLSHSSQGPTRDARTAGATPSTPLRVDPSCSETIRPPFTMTAPHRRTIFEPSCFGGPDAECPFCHAKMWSKERTQPEISVPYPVFSLCCKQGTIKLPPARPSPPLLHGLLDNNGGSFHRHFKENIRVYNSMFQFTSLGGKIDHSVNDGFGPYVFKLNHQTHHRIGPLLPQSGHPPRFAQLYIYDTRNEAQNRIAALSTQDSSPNVNALIFDSLIMMLDQTNEIVKSFRMARDRIDTSIGERVKLRLLLSRNSNDRTYSAPTSSDTAGLIIDDVGDTDGQKDIIVEHTSGLLSVVVSIWGRWIQIRHRHSSLLRGGRLFQQYLVDAGSTIEGNRLFWAKKNQNKIMRVDNFTNVSDAVHAGDVRGESQSLLPGQRPEDRPDLVCRVFKLKLDDLLEDLTENEYFGPAKAVTYTVEFQKRGLPHVHILLWLANSESFRSPANVDRYISAEFPGSDADHIGYEAVSNYMIHGPCGNINEKAQCMHEGKCKKFFPKPFQSETKIDESGFHLYKRRDMGITCSRHGLQVDNRFVVPHNRDLIVKYQAHINVGICNHRRTMKYLFKYFTKGPDRARAVIENQARERQTQQPDQNIVINEIKTYLDCRFLCPYEAAWRIFAFPLHHHDPPVWMVANRNHESARDLLYADFPTRWVWNPKASKWLPRQRGFSIGRIVHIPPATGDLYYLRLLLNVVRGAVSYEAIRTVCGVLYPTFQAACEALGLFEDDRQWQHALDEASAWATSYKRRIMFVGLLMHSQVGDAAALFERNWPLMSDDIQHRFARAVGAPNYRLNEAELRDYVLLAIEDLLTKNASSLADKNLPQPQTSRPTYSSNRMVHEERSYDVRELRQQHENMLRSLNEDQQHVYDLITASVTGKEGKLFFVSGYRGGRTAHSRFKIPLIVDEWSTCEIKRGTQLAFLLLQTSLIVWDEAPMIHRYCFEALDKSLRDILSVVNTENHDRAFGGMTMVFGGDFRQILPVIPGGNKSQILNASISSSGLWSECVVLKLNQNMRLQASQLDQVSREEYRDFAHWLLQVGDGNLPSLISTPDEEGNWIKIPHDLLIHTEGDPIQVIANEIYHDLQNHYADSAYIKERAIVTPYNDTVDQINSHILDQIPGDARTYLSADTLSGSFTAFHDQRTLYPPEILNKITAPGVPNHTLILKVGCVIALMRFINQTHGLCNGTGLIVINLQIMSLRLRCSPENMLAPWSRKELFFWTIPSTNEFNF